MKLNAFFAAAALTLAVGGGATAHADVTITNGVAGSSISNFGYPDSQTYGQVFTAPVTGELKSFTLSLNGGVGSLYGGVGTWNGGPNYALGAGSPVNLYQSADVASTGAQSFTFAPNVLVTAGDQYVAYLSVYGDAAANSTTSMPSNFVADNVVPGIDYFVWNNTTGPQGNPSWNYYADYGTAQFSATFGAVPEPATWAMLILGVTMIGFAVRRQREGMAFSA